MLTAFCSRSQPWVYVFCFHVWLSICCVANGDWPEFRGPLQNGNSPVLDLPTNWNESKNIVWFSATEGLGWSSPVITGNRIYFTSAVGSESIGEDSSSAESASLQGRQQLKLICLDVRNGSPLFAKTIFEQVAGAPKIHNKNSHASPTPVVQGNRIFVHFGQALAPDDGRVLWHVKYDGFSVVPRPIYHRGIVLVCTGFGKTKVLAIDPSGSGDVTDTHVKWTFGTSVPQTPSLVCVNEQILMTSDNGIATSIDFTTGKENWRKRLGGNYSASPFVAGDNLYFQSEQGEAVVFKLGSEVEEIARNQLPGRIFASYCVVDRDLIVRTEQGIYRIGQR